MIIRSELLFRPQWLRHAWPPMATLVGSDQPYLLASATSLVTLSKNHTSLRDVLLNKYYCSFGFCPNEAGWRGGEGPAHF